MTHTYQLTGVTCGSCVAKVTGALSQIAGVESVKISSDYQNADIQMSSHIPLGELQAALKNYPKYQIAETLKEKPSVVSPDEDILRTFWQTYKPVLLIFAYITGATLLIEYAAGSFDWMRWMRHFMAGFFLVFSFFKLLDVPGFAMSYSSYDILARRWAGWGYAYPFVELGLGLLFLVDFNPLITNSVALVVMGLSLIGVVQSLLAKRRFQCACLGAVFNLPMSRITLFEDTLMIAMSGAMLVAMAF